MNKQERHYVMVGLFAIVFIGIVIGAVLFLRGTLNTDRRLNVIFDDAYGIQDGEPVRMAGVRVGQVDGVELREDNRAVLKLGIRRDFGIPEGSAIRIKSGILGNSRTIAIEPAASGKIYPDGATVSGDSGAPIDEALAETRNLVKQGQELVASVQRITGDPKLQKELHSTLANTVAITENLKQVTAQLPRTQRLLEGEIGSTFSELRTTIAGGQRVTNQIEALAKDARQIAGDVRGLAKNLDTTLTGSRQELSNLLVSADDAASSLAALLTSVNESLKGSGLKEGMNKILANADAASKNLITTTDKLNAIADKFDTTAANIAKLTGDEGMNKDIRSTVSNLRDSSASIRSLLERVEGVRFPWEKSAPPTRKTPTTNPQSIPPPTPAPPPVFSNNSLLEPGLVFDAFYDTTLERLRTDANFTLLSGKNRFYRVGLADATESNRLNLQVGRSDKAPVSWGYRMGLFSSKLGLGLDVRPGPIDLRLEMYDPNRFTVDARAKVYLNKNAAITTGISAIGKENRATIGIQIRQ